MDEEERSELLGKLFSLMTAKLEDAATLAADGQGAAQSDHGRGVQLAREIRSLGDEVAVLAEAAGALGRMHE